MSISATWLVFAVLLLRLILKKAPRWTSVLLWGIVGLRLVLPVSIESILSLIPSSEVISPDIMLSHKPQITTGISALNSAINPVIQQSFTPDPSASANPLQIWIPVCAIAWLLGVSVMLLCAAVSYWRVSREIRDAVHLQKNEYLSNRIDTPFVLGIIRPRIYLPASLDGQDYVHVLAHEHAHIARRDHWWKPLGYLLLTIHWFNPVLWIAYGLLSRDIELACDEKVIRSLGTEQRADYSQALLGCSVNRGMIRACPLAFGEVGVKDRVKAVLNYRKPGFWIVVAAVAACAVVAVCFLTDPQNDDPPIIPGGTPTLFPVLEDLPSDYTLDQAKLDGCVVMEDGDVTCGQQVWDEFYALSASGYPAAVRYVHYFGELDPSRVSSELYEETKDDYPMMFVHDLVFDGTEYTVRWFEEKKEYTSVFPNLLKLEGEPPSQANYDYYVRYVLCERDDVTWEDIEHGLYSADIRDQIWHLLVYTDRICWDEPAVITWFDFYSNPDSMVWEETLRTQLRAIPSVEFAWTPGEVTVTENGQTKTVIRGMPIYNGYFSDLNGDGIPELCCTLCIGSGMIDTRVCVYDYAADCTYTLEGRGIFDYALRITNGILCVTRTQYPTQAPFEDILEEGRLSLSIGVEGGEFLWLYQDSALGKDMTLQDVITLSGLGMELTWEDLDGYACRDIGSGLYICRYEISKNYYLMVGSGSQRGKPLYALLCHTDSGDSIDIRESDVAVFLHAHNGVLPLETIQAALDSDGVGLMDDGLIHTHSFFILDQERGEELTLYLLVRNINYSILSDHLQEESGSLTAAVMTLKEENDQYTVTDFWTPRDGGYYSEDIRKQFPAAAAEAALNHERYHSQLDGRCYNRAYPYLQEFGEFDNVYEELLDMICAEPLWSSNPQTYIDANASAFQTMVSFGRGALRYCFRQFLEGGQNDLRGHIMAAVCKEIMQGWREAYLVNENAWTGQTWFDKFLANTRSLSALYSREELEKLYPGATILLETMHEYE